MMPGYHCKNTNTRKRHDRVIRRFDEMMSNKTDDGLSPDMDAVIKKISEEEGYAVRMIRMILKNKP